MIAGAAVLLMLTAVAHSMLPEAGSARKWYSTLQLAGGALVVLAAQFWAMTVVAPHDPSLGAWDLFVISGRLWSRAYQLMPKTRWPVYVGFWGLVLMLGAVTVTGGLAEWVNVTPPGRP
jgi:hypothetical protein